MKIKGRIVDVVNRRVFGAEIVVEEGVVCSVVECGEVPDIFIMPGVVDSHVHIESSMLVPQEFARLAVAHGTVATVSDPHEIANVLGVQGVEYMLRDAGKSIFKFFFGVPSCVPATGFESSGGVLGVGDVGLLLSRDEFKCLSEVMDYPGVIASDDVVLGKISAAKKYNKVIDGHAPGLKGEDLKNYIGAGVSTDHECVSIAEAEEKIKLGMKVLIREGSAAKNFDALIELVDKYPDSVMFCTDDCHPDDLVDRHVIDLVRRGLSKGYDLFNLLRAVTLNPVTHYQLDVGLLQEGDAADFIIVDNLTDINVIKTYIKGVEVYSEGSSLLKSKDVEVLNNFKRKKLLPDELYVSDTGKAVKAIVAYDGDLYTGIDIVEPKVENGNLVSDIENDVLKIVVVNRYGDFKPVIGFVKNFGLKQGAIAGSIAHDSHNIIAVGVKDIDILNAINTIIDNKGGIVAVKGDVIHTIVLPIAGLMSNRDGFVVATEYKKINEVVKEWGSTLNAPFMTLSFMALLVIPEFKIGDKGLFDGNLFQFTGLFVD